MFTRALVVATVLMLGMSQIASAQMGGNLVPPGAADVYAVRDGSWQDPVTWSGGTVPATGQRVFIPVGLTVTNHAVTADVLWIHVAGKLTACDHCNTKLNVHTLYVPMGGSLRLHSTGSCVVEWLPGPYLPGDTNKLSRGLICHGEFMSDGRAKTAWGPVSNMELPVGATSLSVASAAGWQEGDRLIVCGTDGMLGEDMSATHRYQTEVVTVTGVAFASDGVQVTFTPSLKYRHFRWRNDLPFHVGNLTRNVSFVSRDTSTIDNRGHLMFMSSMCRMLNTSVIGCGRTNGAVPVTDPRQDIYGELIPGTDANVRARYAVHWHRIGQLSTPALCKGCVVEGSPKWGFLIHDSNVHLQNCISTGCFGSGFATEEGQERGSIDHCLSVLNRGEGDYIHSTDSDHGRQLHADWGTDGSGFWLQGGMVSLTNSVACDNSGRGIGLFNRPMNGYPNYGTGNPIPDHLRFPIVVHGSLLSIEYDGRADTPSSTVPIQKLDNNTCYNNKVGFQGWSGATHDSSSQQIWPSTVRGSITNLSLWGRGGKLHLEYHRQLNIDGLVIVGDRGFRPAYNSLSRVSKAVSLRSPEVTVRNWSIEGFEDVAMKFFVDGSNDPGGIAAKNLFVEGMQINADGSVTPLQ